MESLAVEQGSLDIAVAIVRQIRRVRLLPSLAHAKAIIVVESNTLNTAVDVYRELNQRFHELRPYELLYLDEHAPGGGRLRRQRTGANTSDPDGLMDPGLRTSWRNKNETADLMRHLFSRRLLHWHQELVAYATPVPDAEAELTDGGQMRDPAELRRRLDLPAAVDPRLAPGLLGDELGHVFEDLFRQRVRAAALGQLKQVSYKKVLIKARGHSDPIMMKKITGKIRDDDKDDLYMGLGMALLGAGAYFNAGR